MAPLLLPVSIGQLQVIKSKAIQIVDQEILEHFMVLSADKLHAEDDFIFQKDLRSPTHTAKGTKTWEP